MLLNSDQLATVNNQWRNKEFPDLDLHPSMHLTVHISSLVKGLSHSRFLFFSVPQVQFNNESHTLQALTYGQFCTHACLQNKEMRFLTSDWAWEPDNQMACKNMHCKIQ